MAQRLKRWESPRRQGRNDKGRGGSARQRQIRKQLQTLRQKLTESDSSAESSKKSSDRKTGDRQRGGDHNLLPFCLSTNRMGKAVQGKRYQGKRYQN